MFAGQKAFVSRANTLEAVIHELFHKYHHMPYLKKIPFIEKLIEENLLEFLYIVASADSIVQFKFISRF